MRVTSDGNEEVQRESRAEMTSVTQDALAPGDAGARVIRGGGVRAAAYVVGVASGLVSAPLVIRHLGVADFGRLAAVTAVLTIAVALTEGGLANVAVRALATADTRRQRSIVGNLLGLRLALGLVAAAGVVAFGFAAGRQPVVVVGLALGGIAIVANGLWGVGATVLTARLRLSAVALIDLARAILTAALLIALVAARADLVFFYAVAPTVALLTLALTGWMLRGHVPIRPRASRREWRSLARETGVYAAATTLGAVYFQVALVTTSLLASAHETGVFGIGFRIVELANGVPWVLAASVFPVLARAAAGDLVRLEYATGRATEVCLAVGGLVLVGIVVGAQVVVDVVGGPEAHDAVAVLRVLGPAALATYFVAAWSFVLLSLGSYRSLLVINGAGLGAAIGLSVVLVPAFGALGAAVVTVVLELGLAAAYAVAIHRLRPELGPRASNLPAVVAALAVAFTVGILLLGVNSLLAAVAAPLVYAAVVIALKGVPVDVRHAIARPLVSRRS